MKPKKTIAVMGATGQQGSGLVRAILKDPSHEFSVRAITRNQCSANAKELKALGAEVVEADVNDLASLISAFEGVYGAFLVSFFAEHFDPILERDEIFRMAGAVHVNEVKHIVYSTMEDTRLFMDADDQRMPVLLKNYRVPQYDVKGEAEKYFADLNLPVTFLNTSFYWENFISFGMGPHRQNGKLLFTLPLADKLLPGIASDDIGKCALGVFKAGNEFIGRRVGLAAEHLSGIDFANRFSAILGEEVLYQPVSPETYRSYPFKGADMLANMFQFKTEFNNQFVNKRSLRLSRHLNKEIKDFFQWAQLNKSQLVAASS